ncbi:hypothetical protein Cgig2_018907 [Carnegiea gigantea]|uniref:Uncharacterized protein n=1 Tax=Carnegiea gigantea TaxID=171969 RepID=A0A9Q1K5U1_9CARY|nr:hypothetical protein Cgig2_018907 [Carnegiea gigantea]
MKGAMLMRACGHGWVCKRKATTLGKKMDKHKQETMKWKNWVGERIEQKLADTYQKMGCIIAMEYYNLMLGEYSVELTNSHKQPEMFTWEEANVHRGTLPCLPRMRPMFTAVNHAVEVLTKELYEIRDLVRTKRNDHHFIQEEDRVVDSKRMCGHDVQLKHSPTRHEKAIIIRRLQASINKIEGNIAGEETRGEGFA